MHRPSEEEEEASDGPANRNLARSVGAGRSMGEPNRDERQQGVKERDGFGGDPPIGETDHEININEYSDHALEGGTRALGQGEDDDGNNKREEERAVVLVGFGEDVHGLQRGG